MPQGTVKFFNATKGFGFITPSDGSKDIFVHISGLSPQDYPRGSVPNEGDTVKYETENTQKGMSATNVTKA